ncbi:hypothetical protein HRI_004710200 [Hibiscus trionum]|uniref:Uncharacterized protein n=1 Tax=Hibiscus trionum TaxID=183268 RepID=A0A9W7JAR5_HIBTR|nr:hypothetical protein HRI_004710200 [Hibiscus trionum]
MTPEAADIMAKLRGKGVEYEATASTDDSTNVHEMENQVIGDVLGPERYGRVRCQGSFITPTRYFGPSSSQYMPSQSQSSQAEVNRLKQQIAQFKAEVAAKEAEREAAYQAFQNQFQELMAMLKKNPPS